MYDNIKYVSNMDFLLSHRCEIGRNLYPFLFSIFLNDLEEFLSEFNVYFDTIWCLVSFV